MHGIRSLFWRYARFIFYDAYSCRRPRQTLGKLRHFGRVMLCMSGESQCTTHSGATPTFSFGVLSRTGSIHSGDHDWDQEASHVSAHVISACRYPPLTCKHTLQIFRQNSFCQLGQSPSLVSHTGKGPPDKHPSPRACRH